MLYWGILSPCFAVQFPVHVGNTRVIVVQETHGKGKAFIHVHQNETTALAAARAIIRHQGGSLLTLKHPGQRNITFSMHHRTYEFDPNRIFTDHGIYKTLHQYGPYSKAAHTAVKRLANQILCLLPKGKIIAVHNNETFSLRDYFPGQNMAKDAKRLHINKQQHYRNFFIVTQKKEFQRLKSLKFNSVLQAKTASDDGSLSIRMTKRNYVNVEAGYDQLLTQIRMLKHA
ncbi:MAG: protein tyrosine phosphatase [Legionella sp.]|nr:MAG: protein tyrosine phosphatase [Legionella sp.]